MKKWIIAISALLILIVFIYIVIPAEYIFNNTVSVRATADESKRTLHNYSNWSEALKGDSGGQHTTITDSSFKINNSTFQVVKGNYETVVFQIHNGETKTQALLHILPKNDSTVWLNLKFTLATGSNPVQRIRNYFAGKDMESDSKHLLGLTSAFLSQQEAENRLKVIHTRVVDTAFITLQFITDHYPSTVEIYNRLDSIERYASAIGARVTGYPMLHISTSDEKQYFNMVALPVNQKVNTSGKFVFKKMIRGNILIYEFAGGPHSTREAFRIMDQYLNDHRMKSPAIPYVSLITDRRAEPDSTKWISKIYYPVY